jgi:hypothetical protein
MGPHTEPVPDHPKVAIVSSAEIDATPGHPLTARVWVERLPGETFDQAARRLTIADMERRATNHDRAADKLRHAIAVLRGDADA